jgi:hypothetical protein
MCRQKQTHAPQQLVALFDHLVGAQLTIPPALAGRDRLDWETQDAPAALSARDVTGGDLVFVGREGCQDFSLLALRDLNEVQGTPSSAATSSSSAGEIRRSRWASSSPSGVVPGLVAVNKGPPETLQDPQRPHELEAGQPSQVLGVPFPQLRVLGFLADDGARPGVELADRENIRASPRLKATADTSGRGAGSRLRAGRRHRMTAGPASPPRHR